MKRAVVGFGVGLGVLILTACESEKRPAPSAPEAAKEPAATAPAQAEKKAPGAPSVAPSAPEAAAPAPAAGGVLERIETDSGLIIEELKIGQGAEAQPYDTVTVNYFGTLADGREFDRSVKPATFSLTQVVKAWQEGVPGMKIGGKRRLLVPPELGYGARGSPPLIPPDSMLIFEIELVDLPE